MKTATLQTESTEHFGASIADAYHRYLVPLIFDGYARDLACRLNAPASAEVLETACGTGALTRHLRAALPRTTRIVATDISPVMVAAAKTNAGRHGGVEFREADGTALPFADASFDVVACQFGVMFYPDKARGFREAARVLRPGGRLVFNVWDSFDENGFAALVHRRVAELLPEDPPDFLARPFGDHDVLAIQAELARAGFRGLRVNYLPRVSRAPSPREVAQAFVAGSPLANELASRGCAERILEEVTEAVAQEYGAGAVCAPMQAIAFEARRGR